MLESVLRAHALRVRRREPRQLVGVELVALAAGHLAEQPLAAVEVDLEQPLRPERQRAVDDHQHQQARDHQDREREARPHQPDQRAAAGAETGVLPTRVARS